MATSLTKVVITALRFSSALKRLARAASVARRSLPQISTSNESRLSVAAPKLRFCDGRSGGWDRRRAIAREAIDVHVAAGPEVGELVRPRDPETRARLFHAEHRVAQIVVLLQCRADQILQLLVLEDLEPFEIGQRRGLARRQRIRRAKVRRRGTAGRL